MAAKLISTFGDKQTVVNEGDPIIKVIWQDDASTEDKPNDLARTTRSSEQKEQNANKSTH
jgi:hypothetical protein